MHVIATAGHVDHGKSTLIRALTGMQPDRWAEERRRGMTIDLGFAWTTLPSGEQIAFVDVPGHERFIANMLAGVGAVPAVLFVVAADEGWMPQTDEHARAVAALPRARVAVVVTKCDLAPGEAVADDATRRLTALGLPPVASAQVSAADGGGLDDVRRTLSALAGALPPAEVAGPVRLWIDRAFTIRGAGTVVTGTLPAGTMAIGDTLQLTPDGRDVVVRRLQSLQQDADQVVAVARTAANLRGVTREDVRRGMALVTPGAWSIADEFDVVVTGEAPGDRLVVHIGSAAVPARVRRLAAGAARVRLAHRLPLHAGDRLLLRDPATRRIAAADVADLHPQPLRRRGAASVVAAGLSVPSGADEEIDRRGVCSADDLVAAGLTDEPRRARRVRELWVSQSAWSDLSSRVSAALEDTGSDGLPIAVVARHLGLASTDLVAALLEEQPDLVSVDGRVRRSGAQDETQRDTQSEACLRALQQRELFDPPSVADFAAAGISTADLARAARAGSVLRLTPTVFLAADAADRAIDVLSTLAQPFTVSDARVALGSTRRVVVPLLEHLDATRRTRKHPDGTRFVVERPA